MPTNHRGVVIDGPLMNTKTGGGGKKPPNKTPTKTGGLPDKDPKDGYDINLPKRYMTPEDWKKETGNGY